jgi:hypothetical protein
VLAVIGGELIRRRRRRAVRAERAERADAERQRADADRQRADAERREKLEPGPGPGDRLEPGGF